MKAIPAQKGKNQAATQHSDEAAKNSHTLTGSAFYATTVMAAYLGSCAAPVHIMDRMDEQAEAVRCGDMSAVEGMLINQAIALQAMFSNLAARAKDQTSLQGVQTLTQLALKSQANCRATLQTLAEIKNPKQVAFVRQTNVAQNQQVNNGVASPSRTRKIKSAPNELLAGDPDGSQEVDDRAAQEAIGEDQRMDAVARVDRATKLDRQDSGRTKRIQRGAT